MRHQPHARFTAMRHVLRLTGLLAMAVVIGGVAASGSFARSHARSHHCTARSHRRHARSRGCRARSHRRRVHHARSRYGAVRQTRGITAHGQFIHPFALNTNESNNWSGYNQGSVEQGGATNPKLFSSIGGDWTVPTATQHTSGQAEDSADWIGIGGGCVDSGCDVTDSTLIQTGTEQDVASNGAASYSAWWEIIPGPSMTITSMTIHPGDHMAASIASTVPGVWSITISDTSDGQSYTTTVPYSSTEDTAEWIEETPLEIGTDAGLAALPNLTSPAFDLATTNGAPANLKSSEEMDLVDSSGNVIAAPSAPDSDNDGFNVCTWESTCAAPTSS